MLPSPGKWPTAKRTSRTVEGKVTRTLRGNCIRKNLRESDMEDDMGNLVMLGQAALGLGVFLMGVAALWFVSVYQEKNK
jgi:hypothetical protein